MLPYNLSLKNLDEGIRNLVVNINRIPEAYTNTTCEGHIWRDCPNWPTKDGWIHFNVHNKINEDLTAKIKKEFLETHQKIFELEEGGNALYQDYFHNTMVAHYESHDRGKLFSRINEQEQQEYFKRADERRKEILRGWIDFDGVIVSYLKDRFGMDYEKLPFRESESGTFIQNI